jgi:presequence protease
MNKTGKQCKTEIQTGDNICGYTVKQAGSLHNINAYLYELEHNATGSKHIHISNDDKENTFSVAFKTVPVDSTGVAHILEHTVLCGSRKYSVRDPFFSMLKRSLSTFMNAFTSSDWTMYPFATENKKDYYNLMEVYLDAAFFPKLEELSFKQEGHRLEINNSESEQLIYKGIVYNEMKGAMSSPAHVMSQSLLNAMYPDTTYSENSGGDPASIPQLTWDQLKSFHERHYHPSNAFFCTYGNLPLKDHLSFIQDKVLNHFTQIDPKTKVKLQPRWNRPKQATYHYPIGKHEDPTKKYQICMAWLTADIKDTFEIIALTLLEQILLGNSGSPLRKALIDSKLGTALSDGTGFDPENRDSLFSCGLKDVAKSDAKEIEKIILNLLENLANRGIDRELIDAAIHQIEFHRKEVTNTPYAYGIKLLLALSGAWFHGGDPKKVLQFDDLLKKIRGRLVKEPFFENLIKKYLLNNPHRVLLTLVPDPQMEDRQKDRVAEQLENIRKALASTDIEKINKDAQTLKALQNKTQDVSILPCLELEDIPASVKSLTPSQNYNTRSVSYEQPTSGIFYFSGAAGLKNLEESLIPLVPFFCYSLSLIGTRLHKYTEIAQQIDAYTGGISLSTNVRNMFGKSGLYTPFISFSGKCLESNQDKMFQIIEQLFSEFDFSDLDRLKSLAIEYRAGLESMVINNGHKLAVSLASRTFSRANRLSEIWHGIHQLQTIKSLTDNLTDQKTETLAQNLTTIGKSVFTSENLKTTIIGQPPSLYHSSKIIADSKILSHMLETQYSDMSNFANPDITSDQKHPCEAWHTSTAVSFVAQVFQTVRMEHEDAPALSVISKIIQSMFLHREIREKGGAYGGFAVYNKENGLFVFGSYRDPQIVKTLKTYKQAFDFIKSGAYTQQDIKEAILQVCSEIDRPNSPGSAGTKAFYRKLLCLSDDARKRFKNNLLNLNQKSVLNVAEKYFQADKNKSGIVVISGKDHILAANEKLSHRKLKLYEI